EEVGPGAIDRRAGEVRIIGGDDPVGERGAGAGLRLPLRFLAVEELRLDRPRRPRNGEFVLVGLLGSGQDEVLQALRADAGEECGKAPELFALPVSKGVVVTLGALDADAEEHARRAGRQVLRLEL